MTVNIQGATYKIEYVSAKDDPIIATQGDAYCDWTTKRIVLQDPKEFNGDLGNPKAYWKKVLRHEIIHAFVYESGLMDNSCSSNSWATNEEMVDWFAIIASKIIKVWKEVGCL